MRDKLILVVLIIFIVGLTFVKNITVLLSLLVLFSLIAYKIALRVFKVILLFNISVSIGYVIKSIYLNEPYFEYLLMFNLRVFDITFAVFYVFSKINILRAFSFSKSLTFLLVATLSQIENFKKTYSDFKLSIHARSVKKLSELQKQNFISSMFYFFLKKSLYNSKEHTLALKARGFFD